MIGHQLTSLFVVALFNVVDASPAPSPGPSPTVSHNVDRAAISPMLAVTPTAVFDEPTKTLDKRDLGQLGKSLSSMLHKIGEDVQGFVTGIPNAFRNYPTGTQVESQLELHHTMLAALPTQVLNLSPYANWTNHGWNVRFHGNVYKQPNHSQKSLDAKAAVFLIGTNFKHLPDDQKKQSRNLTAEIFVVQQGNVPVEMDLVPPQPVSGSQVNQGGVPAKGGKQSVVLPYLTTPEGDFDDFVPIDMNGLTPGNATQQIQKLNVFAKGATLGNATAYLVPPEGFTVVSDIDDILRVTRIYLPKQGILNTFARPFTPWMNMPSIYANWAAEIPNMHFHYLTTTPEQVTRNYMEFIFANYPLGSFDTRPLNFSNIKETFHIRKYLLDKIFDTYPKRKFILIADTSNSDVMKAYPEMALERPGQVQCIFLRNTSATDTDYFPYDTSRFKTLNQKQWMFFITPDDLRGLDIVGGNCYNKSIPQNVSFTKQDELLGRHGGKSSAAVRVDMRIEAWIFAALGFTIFGFFL